MSTESLVSAEAMSDPPDNRPAVAMVANSFPPYRLHAHLRIVRELPQIKLFSVFTHEIGSAAWAFDPPPEINPVKFGPGERQSDLGGTLHEWRKGGRIIRWMKENNIRAVVIAGYNDVGRLRMIRWCARHDVACLLQADSNIHADLARGASAFIKHWLVSRVSRWCRVILPCGSLGVQYFQKYGASPQKMFLMPYEPDYQLIQQMDDATIQRAQQRFGLTSQRKRMVYSGRLVANKRVDLLIDAFAAVAEKRPQWDLLIIGDGPVRQMLESRVPESLRSRVTWTGFSGDQSVVSALYRASDVLVHPSDFEPWALVINESAAAGMAIVASDVVGAAAELVRHDVNGMIFRHGELPDLVQALLRVTDPARTDEMKRASLAVLAEWQQRADPVRGLRAALEYCGVLPPHSASKPAVEP
jgi:glycosyltransferase involved in cell wall biosynthesis